jgi:hypothetical protein
MGVTGKRGGWAPVFRQAGPGPLEAGCGPGKVMRLQVGLASEKEMARLPGEFRAIIALGQHVLHAPTVTAIWTRVGG